jgi:hypothetical protein
MNNTERVTNAIIPQNWKINNWLELNMIITIFIVNSV